MDWGCYESRHEIMDIKSIYKMYVIFVLFFKFSFQYNKTANYSKEKFD